MNLSVKTRGKTERQVTSLRLAQDQPIKMDHLQSWFRLSRTDKTKTDFFNFTSDRNFLNCSHDESSPRFRQCYVTIQSANKSKTSFRLPNHNIQTYNTTKKDRCLIKIEVFEVFFMTTKCLLYHASDKYVRKPGMCCFGLLVLPASSIFNLLTWKGDPSSLSRALKSNDRKMSISR